MPKIAGHFINTEARHFDSMDRDTAAKTYVCASPGEKFARRRNSPGSLPGFLPN